MPADDFDRAWSAGAALSLEQAAAEATGLLSPPPDAPVAETAVAPAAAFVAGLTRREREVLRLLMDGRADREIAADLSINPRTVTTHVTNILAKLGVPTRTAATYAVRHRLV